MDEIIAIAYQATKYLNEMHPDIKEFGASVGFNYAVTGAIQCLDGSMRVIMEIIECCTYRQVRSETFEWKLSEKNFFEMEDDICWHAKASILELIKCKYIPHPRRLLS
jgi:TolB-like protein